MSNNGKLLAKFIDNGLKINAEYLKHGILITHLLQLADKSCPPKNLVITT